MLERLEPTNGEEWMKTIALLLGATGLPLSSVASGALIEQAAKRQWNRLEELLKSMDDRINDLSDQAVNNEKFQETLPDLLPEIVSRIVRERSRSKRDCYRRIMVNAIIDDAFDYDIVLDYIRTLEQLTENHVRMLAVLNDPIGADAALGGQASRRQASIGQFVRMLLPEPKWNEENRRRLWTDLYSSQIISRDGYNVMTTPREMTYWFEDIFTIYGLGLVKYLFDNDD